MSFFRVWVAFLTVLIPVGIVLAGSISQFFVIIFMKFRLLEYTLARAGMFDGRRIFR
ncbi:MAG: hypothetical protein Q7S47_00900 [bacterium]|nr:hypothetical protein [bacterium]